MVIIVLMEWHDVHCGRCEKVGTSPAKPFARGKTHPSKKMKSSKQDKIEGAGKDVAGKAKEATGKAVGNERLQAKGKAEQAEGKTQKKVGDVKKVFGK
jgi:uncharacterized protein YjbJ (UPF0337 family)